MSEAQAGNFNTLYCDLECPKCGAKVTSGIGFRLGSVRKLNYHIGNKIKWEGPNQRPTIRPATSNLKTIGYFNCDNPKCSTWSDCFPEVQEALVVIENDIIVAAAPTTHKPNEQTFDIVEPAGL